MPDARHPIALPDHDLGYQYDPRVVAGLHGEIKLSQNVETYCQCGGKSPFMIFNNQAEEPAWCPCRPYRMQIRRIDRYLKNSGIPAPFRYKYLHDFREHYEDGQPIPGAYELKMRLNTLIDTVQNSESTSGSAPGANTTLKPNKGFYFWGNPGGGKTYFSYIALNELMFHFVRPGKFISLSKSFQEIRHTFDEDSVMHGQALQILENLSTVPFLVIDDFGVQRNTEWELEILYNLIDSRYANQRLTIVTTNQNIDELKELAQGRIYSRLIEMCYIIHASAPDYRERGVRRNGT
ncbi:MAG: ATP-binding protein [bacterium]|nr:ATP-binding protein [bacterium]